MFVCWNRARRWHMMKVDSLLEIYDWFDCSCTFRTRRIIQIIKCLLSTPSNIQQPHNSLKTLNGKKTECEKNLVNRIVFSKCEFKVQTSIQFRILTLTGCSVVALSESIKPFALNAIDLDVNTFFILRMLTNIYTHLLFGCGHFAAKTLEHTTERTIKWCTFHFGR